MDNMELIKIQAEKYKNRRDKEKIRCYNNYHANNEKWRAYFRDYSNKNNAIIFIKYLFEEPTTEKKKRGRPCKLNINVDIKK